MQRASWDMLAGTGELRALDGAALRSALAGTPAAAALDTPSGQQALAALRDGTLPAGPAAITLVARVQAATDAIEQGQPDAEIARLLAEISGADLDEALRASQQQVLALDALLKPVSQAIELLRSISRPRRATPRCGAISRRRGSSTTRSATTPRRASTR